MNFCGNCGARATGTPYCTNCGHPMGSSGAQQAAPDGTEANAQYGAPSGTGATVQQAQRTANPFGAIPISDYVRDALALLLLLIPLGMAWDFRDSATGKVYVILATLLSVVSLALPYLKAASVLPPTLAPAQQRLIRLLANVPYIAVVLVTLVLGYVGDAGPGQGVGDGVGVGVVIGFAGALLAAQGRVSEQDGRGDGALWRTTALGLAALGVLLGVLSIVITLIDTDTIEWSSVLVFILVVAFFVVVPLLAVLGLLRGEWAWRDATVVLGVVGVLATFWAMGAEQTIGEAWSLRMAGPTLLFWPALAVAAAAPGVAALMGAAPEVRRWVTLPVRLLETAVLIAGFTVAALAFEIIDNDQGRGPNITVLILSLVIAAAALVGRNALLGDAASGRSVAVGAAVALVVVGIVKAAVLGAAESTFINVFMATVISAWFVFAVVIAVALTTPKSVRAEYGVFTLGGAGGARAAAARSGAPSAGSRPEAAQVQRTHEPAGDDGRRVRVEEPAEHAAAEDTSVEEQHANDVRAEHVGAAQGADDAVQGSDEPVTEHMPAGTSDEERLLAEEGAGTEAARDEMPEDATRVLSTGHEAGMPVTDPEVAEEPAQVPAVEEPAAPAAPEPEEPVTASGYTAGMASDPGTPLQTLADIAAKEPSLRPYIAMNPSTYPELLEWLGQLGDPAVDDALRRRSHP